MAVPTITRILPAGSPLATPAEGSPAGGTYLEIYGSGFRVPPDPPATGPTGPKTAGFVVADEPQTVRVRFGTAEAPRVEVIRSNLIRVETPPSPIGVNQATNNGAGAVDVIVDNLDDNGDPIAGETVTETDGYTYRRPPLHSEDALRSDLVRTVLQMILAWKRAVLPEVILSDHTDFDPDTTTPTIETESLPAILLTLTGLPENRFYASEVRPERKQSADRVDIGRRVRTVDLNFDVIGIADSTHELIALMEAASDFMQRTPFFEVPRDPDDASKGTARYELDFQPGGGFESPRRPNVSNVRFFSGSIVVRGFEHEGLATLPADAIHQLTTTLKDEVSLDVQEGAG